MEGGSLKAAKFLYSRGWPVILLDEAALANDISAACARAGTRVIVESDHRSQSIEERLIRLDELRAKGLIHEDEYNSVEAPADFERSLKTRDARSL